jgi:hypothetical protein
LNNTIKKGYVHGKRLIYIVRGGEVVKELLAEQTRQTTSKPPSSGSRDGGLLFLSRRHFRPEKLPLLCG